MANDFKVGDIVWVIQADHMGRYNLSRCMIYSEVTLSSILRAYEEGTILYVSTNQSDAEQKLKEMRGGNDA